MSASCSTPLNVHHLWNKVALSTNLQLVATLVCFCHLEIISLSHHHFRKDTSIRQVIAPKGTNTALYFFLFLSLLFLFNHLLPLSLSLTSSLFLTLLGIFIILINSFYVQLKISTRQHYTSLIIIHYTCKQT